MEKLKRMKVMLAIAAIVAIACILISIFAPWRFVALTIMGMIVASLGITIFLVRYYTIRSVVDDRTGPRGYMLQLRNATRELNAAIAAFDERMDRFEQEIPERISVRSAADLARMRLQLLEDLGTREGPAAGAEAADA